MTRTHTIICTAGHIDHGKSALILSLTGYNPDQLKEEQEREMTIDLGFAFYGDRVTFIDVPGHEKFLKTMLAGVSSVDGAILVVAADDGVMPQTREHFDVLKLLGIQRGIIAVTKTDLVDREMLDLVVEEVRELTAGSFLEGAPILPVSNRSGDGIDEFRAALEQLIAAASSRTDRGLFRMWVDRSFILKGVGTVVAGTVLSGGVRAGDRVEILPAGITARIKRMQVHRRDVTETALGERVALNLPGVDRESVKRGDLLATPGHYRPTFMLNARFNLLPSAPKPLTQRTRLRLHLGSSEHIGRIAILEGDLIPPGGTAFVQFRLEDQAMADIGDRYVVRSFSEGRVLGGGVILETHPVKLKHLTAADRERLAKMESAEPGEIIYQYVKSAAAKTATAAELARELAFPQGDVAGLLGSLHRDGRLVVIQPHPKWQVVAAPVYVDLKQAVLNTLKGYHTSSPHLSGMRRTDLKTAVMLDAPQNLVEHLLRDLVEGGGIEIGGEMVSLVGHRVTFSGEQERLKEQVAKVYLDAAFVTPEPGELADRLNCDPAELDPVVTGLCELGILKKLHGSDGKPILYHRDNIAKARELLLDFFKTHKEMRFFEFRELLGSTRKFTTPILMHFDDLGLTYRDGDVRRQR